MKHLNARFDMLSIVDHRWTFDPISHQKKLFEPRFKSEKIN